MGLLSSKLSPFDAQPRYETTTDNSNSNININNNNNNINEIPYNNHYIEEEARLRLNLFGFNISPKTKSSTKYYQDEPKSSSPRSPFSIRKVKTVKPEKIVVADKQGKKKSKRKNSESQMADSSAGSTESRMVIKRDRAKSQFSRSQTTTDPRNANVYERLLRKKHSLSGPADSSITSNSEIKENIERRRSRIRSIQNSVPPLISKNFRRSCPSAAFAEFEKREKSEDFNNNTNQYPNDSKSDKNDEESTNRMSRRDRMLRRQPAKSSGFLKRFEKTPDVVEDEQRTNSETTDTESTQTSIQLKNGGSETRSVSALESKNVLNLTVKIKPDDEIGELENMSLSLIPKTRSLSLKDTPRSAPPIPVSRKISQPTLTPRKASYDLNDSLPDLIDVPKTPSNTADRLKRDYHLTDAEIVALRCILKKADLYEQTVRDRMFKVLKIEEDKEIDLEVITGKVLAEKEIDSLKQKLFMSRKELDSYISFTKKMEREKRQSISEKEELETKIQWHERRLTRFETENKNLKTERVNFLNQIYELKGKSTTIKDSGHMRQKSMDAGLVSQQPELELSKQRLIYEADAFAQERTKLIKERQRLDEEVRKVQIRCVSLLAQLQHSEKTIEEMKVEKEQLKDKITKMTKQSHDDSRKLQERLATAEGALQEGSDCTDGHVTDYSNFIETMKQGDSDFERLQVEVTELEKKCDHLQNEYRNTEEVRIRLDHENMALKDTINVIQKAKEDALNQVNELDAKYRETLSDLKAITIGSEQYEKERIHLRQELEDVSSRLSELQHDAVTMEADQDAFKKFLDKLSLELREKLGEEHISNETEGISLDKQAEIIGKEVISHLNPTRKLQGDYEAMKEERDDLEEEIKYLKFALANRMEIKTMQLPSQKCECSKEKEALQQEVDDAMSRIDKLDAEVNRLHQDKQQLLMSFLNLQASQRSREVSKSDVGMTTDDDLSDDEEDEDTERESDEEYDTDISKSGFTSSNPSLADVKVNDYGSVGSLKSNGDVPASAMVTTKTSSDTSHLGIEEELKDLRIRLQELEKSNQRLEMERVEMLDSLCKQVDANNALKIELDELRGSRPGSRPGSSISKSDSFSSISQDKCANCASYSDEIRSYLSIIEELTEDKLRLEKCVNDLDADKELMAIDLERLTESHCQIEDELAQTGNINDSALKAAKEESQFLLQNIQSLEQENSVLEENLRKLREDKTEILDNLRQAEEDRFGFIRTMSMLTEQKETVDLESEKLKQEIEILKEKLAESEAQLSTFHTSNLSKEEGGDEERQDGTPRLPLGRSSSTPTQSSYNANSESYKRSHSSSMRSPRDFPMRRATSIEDISEMNEELDVNKLAEEVCLLKDQISSYKLKNTELQQSLDEANSLLEVENQQPAVQPAADLKCTRKGEQFERVVLEDVECESNALGTISESSPGPKRRSCDGERRPSDLERRRTQLHRGDSADIERRTSETTDFRHRSNSEQRPKLERRKSVVLDDETPQRKLYGTRKSSLPICEMLDLIGNQAGGKDSEMCRSAKTLSFQVLFNGVPLHTQNDF
ncbi:golgin subfamily B member 1-like isoform X3 [Hydractinia symbiolongicarpus]|uniref:golgin subfamily B member 1-like isoform X3 n=1 Tax=Hydractinia symbiolongicarpus TaxID=13093 RepID=UPI002550F587|nr:golgin subfamily B member 1-like isoform X3 [Hydractinia symbiolongicarpus]